MTEPDTLIVVRIETTELLVTILEELLPGHGLLPACWTDETRNYGHAEFFLETIDEAHRVKGTLEALLADHAEGEPWTLTIGDCPYEDWANSWKAYFKAERVSDHVVIMPSWDPIEGDDGDVLIKIDPGMSFGTGQHGTTRACIRFLDGLRDSHAGSTLLDIGCGSGILSIAGVGLGFTDVTAIDYDRDCVRITRENAEVNGVSDRIDCSHGDLLELDVEPYDVVVANVLAPILVSNKERLASAVRADETGRLILSGILTTEFETLVSEFESTGFRLLGQETIAEWTSGIFAR